MRRIGLLGGTFSPPHAGHLNAARIALERLDLDELWFLPDAQPPHKSLPEGTPDAADRVAMTWRLASCLPGSSVCTIEQSLPRPSYTARTLAALSKQFPDCEFVFIVGTDMLRTLDRWFEPETIFAHARIAALARSGGDDLEPAARSLRERFGARVEVLPCEPVEVSSTELRAALQRGETPALLPEPVLDYIRERGLYRLPAKDAILARLRETLSEKRLAHVLGCARTAKELAPKFGADPEKAEIAGLLHDITRELSPEEQLKICEKYGIMADEETRARPALLHALTGAEAARELGADDEIADAIRCHTTGRPGMTPLDMTLCLADYVEPTRKFKKVDRLRALARIHPKAALLCALDGTIVHIIRENGSLHPMTVAARNDLLARLQREDPDVLEQIKE